MPVGTQKDYYAILGVDRNAKPEQIRKAFHRPCGNSKVSVDFLPVGDGMKGEYSGLMVYSQENSIVPYAVLVEARQVGRWVPKGLHYQFRVGGQLVDLLHDPTADLRVKLVEVPFEPRSRFDPIDAAHSRLAFWVSHRENSQSDAAGRSGEMRVQRARLRERAKSRLKSSHGRVLPDRCSFRALRSLRSRTGLCTIRKSSKALCHSSSALPARSHLLYRSEGISTVWPMLQSPLRVSQIRTRSKCSPHLGGRVSSATSIWPLGTGR